MIRLPCRPADPPLAWPAVSVPRIDLALVLHNHQPVGNFGFVFEDNHRLAYRPMLDALERHPGVRVGLHYTGPLLEWLRGGEARHARARCGASSIAGRSRSLGGGCYEPVLASLPDADRARAAHAHGRTSSSASSASARRGAWLAERVWEPDAAVHARRRRLRVHDPRRRAPARRGRPRRAPLGALLDRRPRAPDHDLRHRAGPALPHPVPAGRGGHRAPARARDRGRRPRRDDGRRRREVRGLAGHLRSSAGGARPGWSASSTRSRRTAPGSATLRPSDALREHPPDRARLHPDRLLRGDGASGRCPWRRAASTRQLRHAAVAEGRPEARWMRGGFWRASRRTTARSTTSTSRCCARRHA